MQKKKKDYKDPLCKCWLCLVSKTQNKVRQNLYNPLKEKYFHPPPESLSPQGVLGKLGDLTEALFNCQIIPLASFTELFRTQHDLTAPDMTKPSLIFSNIIAFHCTLQRKMSLEFKKDAEMRKMFTTEERRKLSYENT